MRPNRRFKWTPQLTIGAAIAAGFVFALASFPSGPSVQPPSFWQESVAGLALESDLVVHGHRREAVTTALAIVEVSVEEVFGGGSPGPVVYVMCLDTEQYPGCSEFPSEAVVFLKKTEVDPANADELGRIAENLFTPLGTQGVFPVVGDEVTSMSGVPASLSDVAQVVRAVFEEGR